MSAAVQQAAPAAPATTRFTQWELIGHGGSADVYKVQDQELGVALAVKILKQDHQRDRRYIESLRREVLISRRLRHPNICPIHDLYEGERGVGIVMDLIEGQDLKGWLKEHRGRLLETMPSRIALLKKLCEALSVAHTLIVHRDLKPANIFLLKGSITNPVVMDFGMSTPDDMDVNGALDGGTPKYMAPEQFTHQHPVDLRSDLYALGLLGYELLTDGQIPPCSLKDVAKTGALPMFDASTIPPPSSFCAAIPPALDRVILQLLDYDPSRRPASAAEVRQVLERTVLLDAFRPAEKGAVQIATATIAADTYVVGERSGSRPCDQPERKVRLAAFRVGLGPVTNGQYRAFIKATGHRKPALLDDPQFGPDSHPVVMVSFEDATAFARWAGGRLPTEMEWEVAARAGQAANRFPWGPDEPEVTHANIDNVSNATTPVGSYIRGTNALGLSDCAGNVWEWCANDWDDSLWKTLPANGELPVSQAAAEYKAIRGGSFDSPLVTGRTSFRHKAPAGQARADIGFRIAFDG
ncbi:MAG: SUMF1/EgtB/PvdO family nonheme iron enzyme [Alphaproteobacteria bacterium]|nr:SUMF1/EgtB/PvdO family nonheme iron enzyme [Alphaproteobacteria bacterium]